jgi:hypothetical protein
VPCNKFLTGWNGRTCERYNRASSGRCDATGACITTCAAIPSQSTVPHVSCGHVGCIRPNSCVSGSNGDSSPSVDSLCFTDGARHGCPLGATCDASGDCVFSSDGLRCNNDIDCYSGFCVKNVCAAIGAAATSARSACSARASARPRRVRRARLTSSAPRRSRASIRQCSRSACASKRPQGRVSANGRVRQCV